MKWAAIFFALFVLATGCNCWRPYYGHTYAPPAYQAAPVYQAPVIQQAPVVQPACAPVVCPPNPCTCY